MKTGRREVEGWQVTYVYLSVKHACLYSYSQEHRIAHAVKHNTQASLNVLRYTWLDVLTFKQWEKTFKISLLFQLYFHDDNLLHSPNHQSTMIQQWFTMIKLHISYIKKAANVILNNTLHRLHACLSFFYLLNTKEDTLKNDGNLTIAGSHWLELFSILYKSRSTVNCLVAHSLQYIFLCVQQKTETHTGLEQLEAVLIMNSF